VFPPRNFLVVGIWELWKQRLSRLFDFFGVKNSPATKEVDASHNASSVLSEAIGEHLEEIEILKMDTFNRETNQVW